jgi:hypothetical protein
VPAREAIMRQPADRRAVAHEGSSPMFRPHEALAPQQVHGLTDRPARDTVPRNQLLFAREPRARFELPAEDGGPKVVGDLLEDGTIAGGIDGDSHKGTYTRADV